MRRSAAKRRLETTHRLGELAAMLAIVLLSVCLLVV
jgi:hypothetical protein